jgi:hypothetical protein
MDPGDDESQHSITQVEIDFDTYSSNTPYFTFSSKEDDSSPEETKKSQLPPQPPPLATSKSESVPRIVERPPELQHSHSFSEQRSDETPPPAPGLQRQISDKLLGFARSISRLGQTETFYCGICLSYETIDEAFVLTKCNHRFCKDCLAGWLGFEIQNGKVKDMTCPFKDIECGVDCQSPFHEDDIQELVSQENFEKFQRFTFMKNDKNARACPKCDHLQIGRPRRPLMSCENCSHEYCFVHSDA